MLLVRAMVSAQVRFPDGFEINIEGAERLSDEGFGSYSVPDARDMNMRVVNGC